MKSPFQRDLAPEITPLTPTEVDQVHGGRQVYLDGALVEMSDTSLFALLTSSSVSAIQRQGGAYWSNWIDL